MADITTHTPPDHQGRQLYTRHWISDYHPGDPAGEYREAVRGQVFFGVVEETDDG